MACCSPASRPAPSARGTPRAGWVAVQCAAAATAALLALATGSLPVLGVLLLLSGLCAGPAALLISLLLDTVAERRMLAEVYALLVCAQLLGAAAGYSLGGALSNALGTAPLFTCAAVALAATAAWTALRRRTLETVPAPAFPARSGARS